MSEADPLFDADNGPLTGLFGWPTSTEGAHLLPASERAWRIHASVSSHSVFETGDDEFVVFDGETSRLWLDYRVGLSDRLEAGILVPWVWHESGSLDSLIDDWHRFFGLPRGNRDMSPEDRLLFEYSAKGESLNFEHNRNGPGDARLIAGWQLREDPDRRVALRASLKLPTGDHHDLLGSGAIDVSLGLAVDHSSLWNIDALSGFYRGNALYLGTPAVLGGRSRRLAGQLAAGLDYQWTDTVAITAQTTIRSAVIDADVSAVGSWSMSLTAGVRFRLPGDWRLTLGFAEDVKVESAPDVTFLTSVSGSL